MVDKTGIDPVTGLLSRQAFLQEVRVAQDQLPTHGRRGCLLIIHFPVLLTLEQHEGRDALNDALRHLLAIVETRLRSRDILGRISGNTLCLLLKQCKESDAVVVADQYMGLLGDVVINIANLPHSMDMRYRIVPLDLMGTRQKQGISRRIKAPAVTSGSPVVKEIEVSTNHVDLSQSKVVSLTQYSKGQQRSADALRVIKPSSGNAIPLQKQVSWRLKPGKLMRRKSLVCCFRLQPIGGRCSPEVLQHSEILASILKSLALTSARSRPMLESQLILPVQAWQIDDSFPGWIAERCETLRVAPADICLSLSVESLTENLRRVTPALRHLNRRGIRLMLEGAESVTQVKLLHKLAQFDYIYISGRTLNDSVNKPQIRDTLESLIQFAGKQHSEICSGGIDTPGMEAHAVSIGVEVGFGRACGRSVPFPNQATQSVRS
jgi:diguanylate cyclase (GGDEF)-like protein